MNDSRKLSYEDRMRGVIVGALHNVPNGLNHSTYGEIAGIVASRVLAELRAMLPTDEQLIEAEKAKHHGCEDPDWLRGFVRGLHVMRGQFAEPEEK